jgi:tetratricopeptide (TPR) repeat protein
MEYLKGESLGECLARIGSFAQQPAAALAIAGQVADALVAAHAKGIVQAVAAQVNDLVRCMLAKPLDARPQSMVEVVQQIESLLGIPCAQFGALILPPEGFPAPGGTVAQPVRTQVRDDAKLESPVVGQTQVLDQSPQSLAVQPPRTVAPLPDKTVLPSRGSKAPLLALVVLALAAAGALVVLRGRTNQNPAASTGSSADLTAIAPFLRDRSEPPWPEACRTGDRQALHTLATAAGQLTAGSTAIERAQGLTLLSTLSEGVAERWMLEARAHQTTDPDASAKASARLLALCPAAAVGQNLRGNALQKMQQLGPAEAAYQAALALAPDYLAPRFNLGLVQLRQDRNADALASFAAIAGVDPDYPHLFLVQAEAHRKAGNQAGAVASLEDEVKHHPDSAAGWWQLGRALSSRDPRRANDAFCRASALGQSSAAAVCKPKR